MTLGKDTARTQPSLCDPLRQVCRRCPFSSLKLQEALCRVAGPAPW